MGELCRFPERGHFLKPKLSEESGLFDDGQRAPKGDQLEFVGVLKRLTKHWRLLSDDDPRFDGGRLLISRLGLDQNGRAVAGSSNQINPGSKQFVPGDGHVGGQQLRHAEIG